MLHSGVIAERRDFSHAERIGYLKEYGSHSQSFSTMQPGMEYFDLPGIGYIAFMKKWGVKIALADPVFGQLRNCMELAIIGALVTKEGLADKSGCALGAIVDSSAVAPEQFHAPKQTPSKASVLKKGRNWVITASGGVQVNSWSIADKAQPSDAPGPIGDGVAGEHQFGVLHLRSAPLSHQLFREPAHVLHLVDGGHH